MKSTTAARQEARRKAANPSGMLTFGSVNLWKIERQDVPQHYAWANNDTLRRLAGLSPTPRGMTSIESWYAGLHSDATQQVFSIKSFEAEMYGWIHLHDIDFRNGTAGVGILLDSDYWGQGHGYSALAALTIHAFEDLRLVRLEAEILSMNRPSQGLFAKLGFQHEGTKRQAFFTAAHRLDVEMYGLLASEFDRPKRQPRSQSNEEISA